MRNKVQNKLTLKTKSTFLYSSLGILGTLAIGLCAFLYFNMGTATSASAVSGEVITSIKSSNWELPSGWDLGRVPANGDRVIIPHGQTKTLNKTTNFNGEIIVNGELLLWKKNLIMDAASTVAVNDGGKVSLSPDVEAFGIKYASYITMGSNYLIGVPVGGVIIANAINGPASFGNATEELLPIELVSFKAKLNGHKNVKILWNTSSEKNNDFFTIERSLDGQNFFVLDTITGAGNSNKIREYIYTDEAPVAGTNYYRLKQTDNDGKSETFMIVSVYNENAEPALDVVSIGPNPYKDQFEINFTSIDNSAVHMKLSDMQGKTIFSKSMSVEKGLNSYTYNEQKELRPGVYLFTIVQKGTPAKTFRLVKSS